MQETDVKNKNRALGALLFPAAGLLEKKKKKEREAAWAQSKGQILRMLLRH